MLGWCRRAIYAILKQKPYNFNTNTLGAYLSTFECLYDQKDSYIYMCPKAMRKTAKHKSAILKVPFSNLSFLLRWHGSLSTKVGETQTWATVMTGVNPSFRIGGFFREILLCLILKRVLVAHSYIDEPRVRVRKPLETG